MMDQVKVVHTFLKKISIEPKTIIEVGARDCLESLTFSELYPDAQIHSFEPDPLIIDTCKKNIAKYKNITLHHKAVSDHEGELDFHVMPSDPGSSSAFIHKSVPQKKITVPCTTLSNEFDEIDLLWMDAQGSELNVLKGASLEKIKVIHSEIFFIPLYENIPDYWQIKKYLNQNGFALYKFSSQGKTFADAIFVNKSYYKPRTPQALIELRYFTIDRLIAKTKSVIRSLRAMV